MNVLFEDELYEDDDFNPHKDRMVLYAYEDGKLFKGGGDVKAREELMSLIPKKDGCWYLDIRFEPTVKMVESLIEIGYCEGFNWMTLNCVTMHATKSDSIKVLQLGFDTQNE